MIKSNKKIGFIFIQRTKNNTHVTLRQMNSDKNFSVSGGHFKSFGYEKSSFYVSELCVLFIVKKAKLIGISNCFVIFVGFSKNRSFVFKVFKKYKINLIGFFSNDKIPFNGCRKKKQRRL